MEINKNDTHHSNDIAAAANDDATTATTSSSSSIGELLCGPISGIIGKVVDHPLDYLKTLKQVGLPKNDDVIVEQESKCSAKKQMKIAQQPHTHATANSPTATMTTAKPSFSSKLDSFKAFVNSKHAAWTTTATSSVTTTTTTTTTTTKPTTTNTTMKMMMSSSNTAISNSSAAATKKKSAPSLLDCVRAIVREDGLKGFYRGVSAPMIGAALENGFGFGVYEATIRMLQRHSGSVTPAVPTADDPKMHHVLLAGAAAGCGTTTVLTPTELIKCRMQVHGNKVYKSTWDCVAKTLRSEGIRAFYTGGFATLAREVPGGAAWFGTYELTQRTVWPNVPQPWYSIPLSGAMAGCMYTIAFYPADAAKTFIQTDATFSKMGFTTALKTIYAQGGFRALYSGLGIAVARALPTNAAIFSAYEIVHEYIA